MYVVHLIPVTRTMTRDRLSYFAAHPLEAGSVVSIPLRGKSIRGIVISSEKVSDARARLRSSPYELRKISAAGTPLVRKEFIEACVVTARESGVPHAAVVAALIPSAILNARGKVARSEEPPRRRKTSTEKLAFQAPDDERFSSYRSMIREEFARGRSVYLCVPTIADGEEIFHIVKRGIEEHTHLLHSGLGKAATVKTWNAAVRAKHPVLIVGTALFFSLPRADLGAIIVEREQVRSYRIMARPWIDARLFAERAAEAFKVRFILAGFPLRTETLYRYKRGELEEFAAVKMRAVAAGECVIADMRKRRARDGSFEVLGDEVRDLMRETAAGSGRMFIFSARRGLAPVTVCRDCGNVVACDRCASPTMLYKTERRSLFICTSCSSARTADEECRTCRGWRLEPLGVGIQRVAEAVRKEMPDAPVFVLDRDTVKSHDDAARVAASFYTVRGSFIIGTEMSLAYLRAPVSHAAVASLDSLFASPEWNVTERIFSILTRLRLMSTGRSVIQTRQPDAPVLAYAANGNFADFYRSEIVARETYQYPPFATLILASLAGTPARIESEQKRFEDAVRPLGLSPFLSTMKLPKGQHLLHCVLRLERDAWPHRELSEILASLPLPWKVEVNPDALM